MSFDKIFRSLIPLFSAEGGPEKACLDMWKTPTASSTKDVYPDMWQAADSSYKEACKKFDPAKKSVRIDLPAKPVNGNGYKLNGIEMHIAEGTTVSATINYGKNSKTTTYKFSKPVIGFCNFKLNLTAGELIGGAFGTLSAESIQRIMEKVSIEKYDKTKTGNFVKPMVICFDSITVVPPDKVELVLTNKEYIKNGWGIFSFGSSKDDCEGANNKANPSYYLGDKFGGEGSEDECRSTMVGPRFGKPMVKWALQVPEWNTLYNKFLKDNNNDKFVALTSTINHVLGSGIQSPSSSWDKVATELNLLGSGFNIWKKNQK